MADQHSRYTIELWSPTGIRTAIFSGKTSGRRIVLSRNEAEEIEWTIPLRLLEKYARDTYVDVTSLIVPRQTEVRIKRGQNYLCGGQIYYAETTIDADRETVAVKAWGFLNLFKDRIIEGTRPYTATNAADIANDLVAYTQGIGPNWNYGVTTGTAPTVGNQTITYEDVNVKYALQELTRRQDSAFDFQFTADKQFKTYAALGSRRPEIIFRYPGNILPGTRFPLDGSSLANRILVYGSGISREAAPAVIQDDFNSQINYKVSQKKITPNDVSDITVLQQKGTDELAGFSNLLNIPILKVNGNRRPYVTDYNLGDYVRVIVGEHPFIQRNNFYRVERIEIGLDENDKEDVGLYVSQ